MSMIRFGKKLFLLGLVFASFLGCGNNSNVSNSNNQAPGNVTNTAPGGGSTGGNSGGNASGNPAGNGGTQVESPTIEELTIIFS